MCMHKRMDKPPTEVVYMVYVYENNKNNEAKKATVLLRRSVCGERYPLCLGVVKQV